MGSVANCRAGVSLPLPPLPSAVRLIRHTSMDPHCAVANVQNFSGSADEAARDSDRASQIPTAAGSDTSSLPGLRAAGEHIHLLRCECGGTFKLLRDTRAKAKLLGRTGSTQVFANLRFAKDS